MIYFHVTKPIQAYESLYFACVLYTVYYTYRSIINRIVRKIISQENYCIAIIRNFKTLDPLKVNFIEVKAAFAYLLPYQKAVKKALS